MIIDTGIILCAGKGSRMGKVGEILPKPLWPLFNTTFLEHQVNYLVSLGVKRIFINVFFHKDAILDKIKSLKVSVELIPVVENELLDVGGGVVNILKYMSSKKIICNNFIVLNCDMLILKPIKLTALEFENALLICSELGRNYNKLRIENKKLLSIEKSNDLKNTFIGVSIFKYKKELLSINEKKFFEGIANFKDKTIDCMCVKNDDIYDLGTLSNYFYFYRKFIFDKSFRDRICFYKPFKLATNNNFSFSFKFLNINSEFESNKLNLYINSSDKIVYNEIEEYLQRD